MLDVFETFLQISKNILSGVHSLLGIDYYASYRYYCNYTYYIYYIYCKYYTDYINYFQVRMELGIANYIWLDKRAAIAQTFDALGDNFKPAISAGWMAYIRKANPDGSASGRIAVGQEQLVID